MKRKRFIVVATIIVVCLATTLAACSSSDGLWKICGIDTADVEKIEIVNSGGAIKVLQGGLLAEFMDETAKLAVAKDDDAWPDNRYDYCLRIYLSGKSGYVRYYLGQEMVNEGIKGGAKEGFYVFADYEQARALTAKYFYSV